MGQWWLTTARLFMKIQIKNRFDLSVIFECEADSLKIAVELAVKQRIDLSCANLSGANLSGEKLDKNPIQLLGLKYSVIITKQQINIGCEIHKVEEWESFDDRRILEMDGRKALEWWRIYKPIIMALQKEHLN